MRKDILYTDTYIHTYQHRLHYLLHNIFKEQISRIRH